MRLLPKKRALQSPPAAEDGYQQAVDLLHRCNTEHGFLATPTDWDNCRRVWGRDGSIISLAALLTGDADLESGCRNTLETLVRHQGPHGEIPSNVDPATKRVSYGGTAGRVDANLWFVLACCEYWQKTGDDDFLDQMIEPLEKVRFLLGSWEFNTRGLLYIPPTGDWADEYLQSGYVLYEKGREAAPNQLGSFWMPFFSPFGYDSPQSRSRASCGALPQTACNLQHNTAPTELFTKSIRGHEVPTLGFGTFELSGETCRKAVTKALQTGYRHIDTARMYENEEAVGQGIRDSGLERKDFFLTSKVWWEDLSPAAIRAEVEASLQALQTDHLDLALIHWPNPEYSMQEAIETLAELKESGKIKLFGVSNFDIFDFELDADDKEKIAALAKDRRQIEEISAAFSRAHDLGLFTVLWCYLRNEAFQHDDQNDQTAADLTGQANHLGVTMQADLIKQKQATHNGGYLRLENYGKSDPRMYDELCSDHPIDLCRWQVANCYMGRIGLINSGGASSDNDFRQAVRTAIINKRAGGCGLISGRKVFQRPKEEGIEMLHAIQDVYLEDEISVA